MPKPHWTAKHTKLQSVRNTLREKPWMSVQVVEYIHKTGLFELVLYAASKAGTMRWRPHILTPATIRRQQRHPNKPVRIQTMPDPNYEIVRRVSGKPAYVVLFLVGPANRKMRSRWTHVLHVSRRGWQTRLRRLLDGYELPMPEGIASVVRSAARPR